jgi:flagellin-like hook-associated protein FlgL
MASGQLGATTLPNGLTMSAWSGFAPVVTLTSDDSSLPSNYLRLTSGSAYTEPTIGDVTATLQDQGGGVFDLKVDWSFEGGGSSTSTITNVQADTDLNLGYGLKARFDSAQLATHPFTDGASFTGRADPRNFEVGDTWEVDLQATVHAGDSFRVRAQPQDLVEDTTWQFTAYTAEWETGDEVTLTYNHNFEAPLQTLTDTLTYGGDVMEAIKITGTGHFETGDEIRVNTRAYLGGVTSSGYYTNNLYPTNYLLTVTKGGELGQAEVTWVRTDGRTDTERGGVRTITNLQADTPIYLEEGVYVTFNDLGQSMYLAQGDQIEIPVGQKLEYTFGAQLSLQSRDNIELSYSEVAIDNQLGRVMFLGDEVQQDEQGWEELSLQKGMIGASEARSLKTSGLLSMSEVREALSTIDVALAQVSEAQTKVGAGLKRAEHRLASLNETAANLLLTKGRLEGADIAQETLSLAAEQIALMSAPMLSEVSLSSALTALDLVRQSER